MIRYGNRNFTSRKELFGFLYANKEVEIAQRKAKVQFGRDCLNVLKAAGKYGKAQKDVVFSNDEAAGILQRTLLVNTYLWRDSHYDVHLPGVFTRSIQQKGTKILPIDQHKFDLDYIIGETVALSEQPFTWSDLGVNKDGDTIGVVAQANIVKAKSPKRYDDYLNDRINQHSVGMMYLQCALAIDDQDFPLEYEFYKEWIDKIGNQQEVEEDGFFYGVIEAKLLEYSCVIAGSNELTPVLYPSKGITENGGDPSNDILNAAQALANKLELRNKLTTLNSKLCQK